MSEHEHNFQMMELVDRYQNWKGFDCPYCRIAELEAARDRLLSACQDSDDGCHGTLSTTFVQRCFASNP